MRNELIEPLFQAVGFTPNIMVVSSFNAFLEKLAAEELCNTIISQIQVSNHTALTWFYLPGGPRFHFGACYAKSYRLSSAMRHFIELARKDAQEHLDFPSAS